MGRRVSRLTMRKSSSKNKARNKIENDDELGGEKNAPDDAQWNQMNTYGTFCITDSEGMKHNFRRGQIATILPDGKDPNKKLEPHEYWVGRIMEIRSDGSSCDSNEIWCRVQWFYSAQDALPFIPSLDVSSIGPFERLKSNHWDYVLPQTFNEVVSMTNLYTFPRNGKEKKKKVKAKRHTTASSLTESNSDMEITLESQIPIAPNNFYYRYSINVQNDIIDPIPDHGICICSKPYRPEEDSALTGVMRLCPRPSCNTGYHLKCLQSTNSIWTEQDVIVPTLKKGKTKMTKTTTRQKNGKSKGKQCDESIIKPSTTTLNLIQIKDEKPIEGLTQHQIRLLCSSLEENDNIDLIDLITQGKGHAQQIFHILHRYYIKHLSEAKTKSNAMQLSQLQQNRGPNGEPPNRRRKIISMNESHHTRNLSSTSSRSIIEVENLLIGSDNNSVEDFPSTVVNTREEIPACEDSISSSLIKTRSLARSKDQKRMNTNYQGGQDIPTSETKPINMTPAILLYTLFLAPLPEAETFKNSWLSLHMIEKSSYSSSSPSSPPPSSPSPLPPPPSSPPPLPSPITHPYSYSPTTDNKMEEIDEEHELEETLKPKSTSLSLLLSLATQPLIRGGGYYPYLGPTGNVNVVIKARKMVLDGLKFVGDFRLSSECIQSLDEVRNVGDEKVEMGWKEIRSSLETFLNGWREKLENDRDVLVEGCEIEDAIIIILNQDNDNPKLKSKSNSVGVEMEDGNELGDINNTKNEQQDEGGENRKTKVTKKRKRSKHQENNNTSTVPQVLAHDQIQIQDLAQMGEKELLKVDWACPGCNGTI